MQALAIDPCFRKALHWRARAAAAAGDLDMAVEDMEVGGRVDELAPCWRQLGAASFAVVATLCPAHGFAQPGGSLQGCLLRRLADT